MTVPITIDEFKAYFDDYLLKEIQGIINHYLNGIRDGFLNYIH